VCLWLDNKPVYMASNVDQVEPVGVCQRYSRKERKYVGVQQPAINKAYNKAMGGVDLLDNSVKDYLITTCVRKWYWCIYTWFLNVCLVQAWRLFRAHLEKRRLQMLEEMEEDARWEKEMANTSLRVVEEGRKERQKEKRRRRTEEKKFIEMPLLEFTRQVVEMTFQKHGAGDKEVIVPQREASARLTSTTIEQVRYDSGSHLPLVSEVRGVCKVCKKRSTYRCIRCEVALHTDKCFYKWHVPEEDWIEGI